MRPRTHQYTVGWICALPEEYTAACQMLDEEHPPLDEQPQNDTNSYTLGSIGHHNVVIACLPLGKPGIQSSAVVANTMLHTFPEIRFGLMVGVGGGVPDNGAGVSKGEKDIHLGDVVVGASATRYGGVIAFQAGKELQEQEFEITRSLNAPPQLLLTHLSSLEAYHQRKGMERLNVFLAAVTEHQRLKKKYARPPSNHADRLYQADYVHPDRQKSCADGCNDEYLVPRRERDLSPGDNFVVHYGVIVSSDKVIKDAKLRDELRQKYPVLCVEMEAAGLDNFPCVVIRGICDYADSHKNDVWKGYAAATAAAYAKELLYMIAPEKVLHEMHETAAARMQSSPRDSHFLLTDGSVAQDKTSRQDGFVNRFLDYYLGQDVFSRPTPAAAAIVICRNPNRSSSSTLEDLSDEEPRDLDIVNDISKGQEFLDDKSGTPDLKQRLEKAEKYFSRACHKLSQKQSADFESQLLIYNGLMRVELNKTLIKAKSQTEKRACLDQAFFYNELALQSARRLAYSRTEVPRVEVRRAILIARKTELDCLQSGIDPKQIDQWKKDAMQALESARRELDNEENSEIDLKLIKFADKWSHRIKQL